MKLYADIVFKNEKGMEFSHVVQEETRQYEGFEFSTIHEFIFNWKVAESYEKLDIINSNKEDNKQ